MIYQNINGKIAIQDIAQKYTFSAQVLQYSSLYEMFNNTLEFYGKTIIYFYDLLICTFLLFAFMFKPSC